MLQIISNFFHCDINEAIWKSGYNILMVDETSLTKNNFAVHKVFVGLYAVAQTNADTLTKVVQDALTRFQRPLNDCQGQWYHRITDLAPWQSKRMVW